MKAMQQKNNHMSASLTGLAILVLLGAVAGCASKGIVGKWTGDLPGMGGRTTTVNIEYKADGTEVLSSGANMSAKATYKAENDTLTQTITGVTFNGQSMNVPSQTQSAKYKVDGDTLTLTPSTGTTSYTLKRQDK